MRCKLWPCSPSTRLAWAACALRAGAGPVREHWLSLLKEALKPGKPLRRLPLNIADERLLGGLDLAATLEAGRPVAQKGLLAEADGGVVILAMAERLDPATAGKLCSVMDVGVVTLQRDGLSRTLPTQFGVVALDEGAEPDEKPPAALLDRLAFHLDLTEVSARDIDDPAWSARALVSAREVYGEPAPSPPHRPSPETQQAKSPARIQRSRRGPVRRSAGPGHRLHSERRCSPCGQHALWPHWTAAPRSTTPTWAPPRAWFSSHAPRAFRRRRRKNSPNPEPPPPEDQQERGRGRHSR